MLREPIPFGKYLLLDRISVGGMAEVFKAKAFGVEGFEKILAIKRILPNMIEDEDFIEMFIDEAKIAGQLNHANICQIFELGRFDRAHYIAMEYISGKDLLQILSYFQRRQETFPLAVACFIVAKLCEGLDYAHRKHDARGNALNIVHRDISPQNVLASFDGEIKLIDFGIAKARYRSSKTAAGVLKGKFGYMSPEQVRGLKLDRRSDVFALGTLLYEMIAGIRLFVAESDFSTLEKVRNVDISPPRRYNPGIPAELERITMKALARTPEGRYQWANELQEELQAFMLMQKPLMTTKRLAAWMKNHFSEDIKRERSEHEQFLQLKTPQEHRPGGNGAGARALPSFDAFEDDDEETALMKEKQGSQNPVEAMAAPVPTASGSGQAATQAQPDQPEDIHDESTVIFWSDDDEEAPDGATMILLDDEEVPDGATMILSDDEEAPDGATMILSDDEEVPEGATMLLPPDDEDATHILDDDGVVEGIPLAAMQSQAAASAAAPAPEAAPGPQLPSDLPEPKVHTDPFGVPAVLEAVSPATATPARSDTAEIDLRARAAGGRPKPLLLVIVALAAAVVFGALGFFLGRPGEVPKPKPPPPAPASATVLVKVRTPVSVTVGDKASGTTGTRGALLLHPLEAGKHVLTLTATGYRPLKAEFEVKAGQALLLGPYVLKEKDKPSTLVIVLSDMFKDAEVRLAGKIVPAIKLGTPVPLSLNTKVELRVGMLGYVDHVETIDTSHDKQLKTKMISLEEAVMGQLALDSVPPGAAIYLNGKKRDCVTPCRIQYLQRHKKYRVRLSLSGYKDYTEKFGFKKNRKTHTIDPKLKKKKG
jgi:serine/threonine protein kinase